MKNNLGIHKMSFDRMKEYVEALFNVFNIVNNKSDQKGDKKSKYIALVIYNYMVKTAKDNNVDLRELNVNKKVDLSIIFDYINHNQIQLYDFNNIEMESVDITKREDIECFVLTHVYYITQGK
jgi:hypothetical protein